MSKQAAGVQERFGDIYPVHVTAFARLLTTLRQEFDGDLDLLLIMTVIGERRLQKRILPGGLTYANIGSAPSRPEGGVTINAHSLSAYTGMPRETVRRKIATLVARGWVERDPQGDLHPTRKAADDLCRATAATLEYIGQVVGAWDGGAGQGKSSAWP